jgi:hypothetical protein
VNGDGTVQIGDVQVEVNQILGIAPCTTGDINHDGKCDISDLQRVIAAALGGACTTSSSPGPGTNGVADSLNLYEVDGVTQTNRPVSFGRIFAQGEIAQCPQPVIGGAPVTDYQADVKNRWGDGSVKFAIISFTKTLGAGSATPVTFQSTASCNNTGFLSQAQMLAFNGGNWGGEMDVSANGIINLTDAKMMLQNSDPAAAPECGNNYWLRGPVVTQVIVQDCSPAFAFDFGYKDRHVTTLTNAIAESNTFATVLYAGDIAALALPTRVTIDSEKLLVTAVNGNKLTLVRGYAGTKPQYHAGAALVTSDLQASSWEGAPTADFKSLHPTFILSFYPALNSVKIDFVLEDMWIGKMQDQVYSFTLKTGNPSAQVYSHPQFTHTGHTRWRKTFWSGISAGHIRIDHNFPYLISTKAFPNYDQNVIVDPTRDYNAFVSGDHGDIGGTALLNQAYADNGEGAPLQREELDYLYSMKSCGIASGACAKAWHILTGESGGVDSGLSPAVAGGAGMWTGMGNVPYHYRESRSSGTFYCPGYADKNATPASPCGSGSGNPAGRAMSQHAHPQDQIIGINVYSTPIVGATGWAGWGDLAGDCSHWLDYSYTPYLLTGDYYFLDDEFLSAGFCISGYTPGTGIWQSNGFFGFMNPSFYTVVRRFAWGIQTVGRAAFIAPDNTPESSFFTAMLNSNLEVLEGFMQITGTPLTPANTNSSCGSYVAGTANRWDWGRCSVGQNLKPSLHTLTGGECPAGGGATDYESTWQYWFASLALSHLRELGFSQVTSIVTQTWQREIEMVDDPSFNPYLVATYAQGIKSGSHACGSSGTTSNPYFPSWAAVKAALPASIQNVGTFNHAPDAGAPPDPPWSNYMCADHGYSLVARAVGTYLGGTTSGSFSGTTAWNWLNANVPYFSRCGDQIIKFALAPRQP